MRARTAIAWTAHRVRLTAVGWGLLTVLACIALAACTGSGTSTPPAVFSPTVSGSSSVSASASSSASASIAPVIVPTSASASSSASASIAPVIVPTSASASPSYTPYSNVAPGTGGGGTAGFQDAGLAILGGAAIVVGFGSIAYRRRMTRNR